MKCMEFFEKISHYLDPIFALCLIGLGVIRIVDLKTTSAEDILLIAYYFGFALMLISTLLFKKSVYKYLGFLRGTFWKGVFYLFLATLAIVDYEYWASDVIGGVMILAAVFNMVRFFGKLCDGSEDSKDEEKQ